MAYKIAGKIAETKWSPNFEGKVHFFMPCVQSVSDKRNDIAQDTVIKTLLLIEHSGNGVCEKKLAS